jgi:hypothetical protein
MRASVHNREKNHQSKKIRTTMAGGSLGGFHPYTFFGVLLPSFTQTNTGAVCRRLSIHQF